MNIRLILVLLTATLGILAAVYTTIIQLRNRNGDSSHQRRGITILFMLLLVLIVLEGGLRGTSFRPETKSFLLHMLFAIPTVVLLPMVVATGFVARIGKKGSRGARKIHSLLNKPAGMGVLLWLSASIVTGVFFVVISLANLPA